MGTIINFQDAVNARRIASEVNENRAATEQRNEERAKSVGAKVALSVAAMMGITEERLMNKDVTDNELSVLRAAAQTGMELAQQQIKKEDSRSMAACCDPRNEWQGVKYQATRDMSRAELAKLMRTDIKAAIARGTLPKGIKVSVRTHEYSGGGSINMNISALPESVRVYTAEYVAASKNFTSYADIYSGFRGETYTEDFQAIMSALKSIHSAYNRDNSDSMTDYFDRNYYGDVSICWECEKAIKAREAN